MGGFFIVIWNAALGLFILLAGLGFLDVFWLFFNGMGQEYLLEGVAVHGAVFGFDLLRDLTYQDLVVVELCLVNFDCRLGSL